MKTFKELLKEELDESDRYNEGCVCHDFEKCWNSALIKSKQEQKK